MQGLRSLPLRKIHYTKHILSIASVFILITLATHAQQVQHSLYPMNPLALNPAQTGDFMGNWRFTANYRNQWVSTSDPFRTSTASFDSKLHFQQQTMGVGLFFMNDESGVGGLSYNKIFVSVAYQLKLNENYFWVGLQPGYVFAAFNTWNNWDYTTGTFTAPSGESNFGESTSYFDLNAGISWRRQFGRIQARTGISLLHLNTPNISFFEGEEKEDIISIVDLSAKIGLTEKVFIEPGVLLKNGSGVSLTAAGVAIGYKLSARSQLKDVFLSAQVRNGILDELSSLTFAAGMHLKRIDFAVNYDMNIGNYSNAVGSMGAFEVAVIYRSITTILNSYSIPCERY